MAIELKPKLEFYTIELVSKDKEYKTFRDFTVDELYERRPSSDAQIMNKLYDHFMNNLATDLAKSSKVKKQLKFIRTSSNKYLSFKPTVDISSNIISGVISGGRFGRYGMMSDSKATVDDANAFGKDKTILRYYYFLLYLPLDHNVGCLMIHSNSKEESITDVFKHYISKLFKRGHYEAPSLKVFCPKSFQEEFQKGAIIKSLEVSNTYLDSIFTEDNMHTNEQLYDVKIEIRPRGDDGISLLDGKEKVVKLLKQLGFIRSTQQKDSLDEFKNKKMTIRNVTQKSDRTFDLDDDEVNIIPVVYLENHINNYYDDDTPNFDDLNTYCRKLFNDEILPDIRPDLFV